MKLLSYNGIVDDLNAGRVNSERVFGYGLVGLSIQVIFVWVAVLGGIWRTVPGYLVSFFDRVVFPLLIFWFLFKTFPKDKRDDFLKWFVVLFAPTSLRILLANIVIVGTAVALRSPANAIAVYWVAWVFGLTVNIGFVLAMKKHMSRITH